MFELKRKNNLNNPFNIRFDADNIEDAFSALENTFRMTEQSERLIRKAFKSLQDYPEVKKWELDFDEGGIFDFKAAE